MRRLPGVPETTVVYEGDSRDLSILPNESVHLVVTSPPYAALKRYEDHPAQLGHIEDYETFLVELDKVWAECARVLVPGGRIACVVGDVCVSRRQGGRHYVLPLSADIQVRARTLGLDALTPIRWLKVTNINLEASNSSRFLGKPNLPNGVVKNDIEHILFLRKAGYRKLTADMERRSHITTDDYAELFSPVWTVGGASTREHPAPYPPEIASRLIRMFSFVGDTVLDPFAGTGTTNYCAMALDRRSIGIEIEPKYIKLIEKRLGQPVILSTTPRSRMSTAVKLSDKAKGIVHAIGAQAPVTAKAVGTTSTFIAGLVASGYVATAGTIKGAGRGRPANSYKLTAKGKRLSAKLAAA